jgi:hypothetical protein
LERSQRSRCASAQRPTPATVHVEACGFPDFPLLAAKIAFPTEW